MFCPCSYRISRRVARVRHALTIHPSAATRLSTEHDTRLFGKRTTACLRYAAAFQDEGTRCVHISNYYEYKVYSVSDVQ